MARYYDLDKLSKLIEAKADTMLEGKGTMLYVAKWLNLLPTADVEEVRHGNWVLARRGRKVVCSCCETPAPFDKKLGHHTLWCSEHCPNCGAKMEGGKTE